MHRTPTSSEEAAAPYLGRGARRRAHCVGMNKRPKSRFRDGILLVHAQLINTMDFAHNVLRLRADSSEPVPLCHTAPPDPLPIDFREAEASEVKTAVEDRLFPLPDPLKREMRHAAHQRSFLIGDGETHCYTVGQTITSFQRSLTIRFKSPPNIPSRLQRGFERAVKSLAPRVARRATVRLASPVSWFSTRTATHTSSQTR